MSLYLHHLTYKTYQNYHEKTVIESLLGDSLMACLPGTSERTGTFLDSRRTVTKHGIATGTDRTRVGNGFAR